MTPRLRKLLLTTHITCSVGWIGAVSGFLVLSIAGLTSHDPETVRAAYLAMDLIGGTVIVPMSLASLATGLIQALGTRWGLRQHYWVLMKFVLAIFATAALLVHQFAVVAQAKARVLGGAGGTVPTAGPLGIQLVGDAALAIVVLLSATALSVYKPWGRTRHGQRKQAERRRTPRTPHATPIFRPDNDKHDGGPRPRVTIALVVGAVIVIVLGWLLARPSVISALVG